jgi:hypothetical protein
MDDAGVSVNSVVVVVNGPFRFPARPPIRSRCPLIASSPDSQKELLSFHSGEWLPLSRD